MLYHLAEGRRHIELSRMRSGKITSLGFCFYFCLAAGIPEGALAPSSGVSVLLHSHLKAARILLNAPAEEAERLLSPSLPFTTLQNTV